MLVPSASAVRFADARASPGFDGWVQLVREEFETEDQAIDGEKGRLRAIARGRLRKLEEGEVDARVAAARHRCGAQHP